ncbi:hypothetical protein M3Y99_01558400 [Aphelenchoides fujianensis]|nr:hypothetical protein M3Y99_01558400 [Aphelenchoides fujianensis]
MASPHFPLLILLLLLTALEADAKRRTSFSKRQSGSESGSGTEPPEGTPDEKPEGTPEAKTDGKPEEKPEEQKKCSTLQEAREQCDLFRQQACPLSPLLFAFQPSVYNRCLKNFCSSTEKRCRALEVIAGTCFVDTRTIPHVLKRFDC